MNTDIIIRNGTVLTGYTKIPFCDIALRDGKILDVFNTDRFEKKEFSKEAEIYQYQGNVYITPGFIDTHIHGFGGFGVEDGRPESILGMSKALAPHGVTRFFPTIYTETPEEMCKSIDAVVAATGKEEGAKVAGIHIEGPFISPKRAGALNPKAIQKVNLNLMQQFIDHGKGWVKSMTVAPEIKGMRELALFAMKHHITLQAGHTDAKYSHMLEGMQAGILHSTHFFNAMSRLHHRDPGAVGSIMIHPEMACEVIADGKHVHHELLKLVLRDKPVSKMVLVTDSLTPTEQQSGRLVADGEEVELRDGLFYKCQGQDLIAGSSLTMIRGVQNLTWWGVPVESAVQMATSSPARIHKLDNLGALVPTYAGDLVVFTEQYEVLMTIVDGKIVYKR